MAEPAVRRLALLGGESGGKTTLARALAAALRTGWVPEYGRQRWQELRETLSLAELWWTWRARRSTGRTGTPRAARLDAAAAGSARRGAAGGARRRAPAPRRPRPGRCRRSRSAPAWPRAASTAGGCRRGEASSWAGLRGRSAQSGRPCGVPHHPRDGRTRPPAEAPPGTTDGARRAAIGAAPAPPGPGRHRLEAPQTWPSARS